MVQLFLTSHVDVTLICTGMDEYVNLMSVYFKQHGHVFIKILIFYFQFLSLTMHYVRMSVSNQLTNRPQIQQFFVL